MRGFLHFHNLLFTNPEDRDRRSFLASPGGWEILPLSTTWPCWSTRDPHLLSPQNIRMRLYQRSLFSPNWEIYQGQVGACHNRGCSQSLWNELLKQFWTNLITCRVHWEILCLSSFSLRVMSVKYIYKSSRQNLLLPEKRKTHRISVTPN